MGKRSDLGTVDCPYCNRTVRKRHPAQLICGKHECRLASKRRYEGVTFVCGHCGKDAQKKRSNHRYCPAPECQAVSKGGTRASKTNVTCPYCALTVVARNTRQVTCLSDACSAAHKRAIGNRNRKRKRVGDRFVCRYCPTELERIQENQVTCSKPGCRKARKKERAEENRVFALRRNPKICPVCFDPILEKRFGTHPKCKNPVRLCEICDGPPRLKPGCRSHLECQRRQRNDKRRFKRNIERLGREKAAAFARKKPRSGLTTRGNEPDIALRQHKSSSR